MSTDGPAHGMEEQLRDIFLPEQCAILNIFFEQRIIQPGIANTERQVKVDTTAFIDQLIKQVVSCLGAARLSYQCNRALVRSDDGLDRK